MKKEIMNTLSNNPFVRLTTGELSIFMFIFSAIPQLYSILMNTSNLSKEVEFTKELTKRQKIHSSMCYNNNMHTQAKNIIGSNF